MISVSARQKTIARHTRFEGMTLEEHKARFGDTRGWDSFQAGYDPVLMATFRRYARMEHRHHYVETVRVGHHSCAPVWSREMQCIYCNTRFQEAFIPGIAENSPTWDRAAKESEVSEAS
jgi:hypothetical protein